MRDLVYLGPGICSAIACNVIRALSCQLPKTSLTSGTLFTGASGCLGRALADIHMPGVLENSLEQASAEPQVLL